MILEDSDVETRLNSEKNLCVQIKRINRSSKKVGDTRIPSSVKELIADIGNQTTETQEEIGAAFGITQETVSNTLRGLVGNRFDINLAVASRSGKKALEEKNDTAHELALDNLLNTLGMITEDKLTLLNDPRALSKIATDMSKIVKNLKPEDKSNGNITNVQVVLHAPEQRKEKVYEVIEA